MAENKKGYWVYSVIAIIVGFAFFAFLGYLIYDLVIKLSEKDFSNNTVIQALITLIITVFIGGYYSKWLEHRNAKRLELYKIQSQLAISIIELSSLYINNPNEEKVQAALFVEASKVKLYFSDDTLRKLNALISAEDKKGAYEPLIDSLKNQIKR